MGPGRGCRGRASRGRTAGSRRVPWRRSRRGAPRSWVFPSSHPNRPRRVGIGGGVGTVTCAAAGLTIRVIRAMGWATVRAVLHRGDLVAVLVLARVVRADVVGHVVGVGGRGARRG